MASKVCKKKTGKRFVRRDMKLKEVGDGVEYSGGGRGGPVRMAEVVTGCRGG